MVCCLSAELLFYQAITAVGEQTAGLFRLDELSAAADPYVALVVGDTFTQQDISNGHIEYRQNGQEPVSTTIPDRLELSVQDEAGNSQALLIDITVSPNNDAPILDLAAASAFGNHTILESQPLNLLISESMWSDTDAGDDLSLEVLLVDGQALPAWLTISSDGNATTLSGVPENSDVGIITIGVTAVDLSGERSAALVFDLEVVNVNTAPVNLALDNLDVDENSAGMTVGIFSANDLDVGDELTYSVDDNRFDIVAGELTLKPDVELDHESEPFIDLELTATDNSGFEAILPVRIEVDDTNDTPQLLTNPSIPLMQANTPLQLPVDTFVDQDQLDTITYSAILADGGALPSWLEFTPQREFILLTESPGVETLDVILIADDANGGIAQLPLTLTFDPILGSAEPVAEPVDVPEVNTVIVNAPVTNTETEAIVNEESSEPESEPTNSEIDVSEQFVEEELQEVDLQDLIAPLPTSSGFELVEVATTEFGVLSADVTRMDNMEAINVVELSVLLDQTQQPQSKAYTSLENALDDQREEFAEDVSFRQKVIGSSVTLTSGFSVGYVIWLIRGGTLMGSMLSALPAWRMVDPLPILGALEDGDAGEDDSLEALVDSNDNDSTSPTDGNGDNQEGEQQKAA